MSAAPTRDVTPAPLCVECAHYRAHTMRAADECLNPIITTVQPVEHVRGEKTPVFCATERGYGVLCGSRGRLWLSKTPF